MAPGVGPSCPGGALPHGPLVSITLWGGSSPASCTGGPSVHVLALGAGDDRRPVSKGTFVREVAWCLCCAGHGLVGVNMGHIRVHTSSPGMSVHRPSSRPLCLSNLFPGTLSGRPGHWPLSRSLRPFSCWATSSVSRVDDRTLLTAPPFGENLPLLPVKAIPAVAVTKPPPILGLTGPIPASLVCPAGRTGRCPVTCSVWPSAQTGSCRGRGWWYGAVSRCLVLSGPANGKCSFPSRGVDFCRPL